MNLAAPARKLQLFSTTAQGAFWQLQLGTRKIHQVSWTGMRESRINSNLCRLLGSCAKIESECIVLSGLAVCCCGIALFEIVICVVLGDGFRDVLLRVHVFGGCRFGVSFGMFCVWFGDVSGDFFASRGGGCMCWGGFGCVRLAMSVWLFLGDVFRDTLGMMCLEGILGRPVQGNVFGGVLGDVFVVFVG